MPTAPEAQDPHKGPQAIAGLESQNPWSGAGSNRRPSAFQGSYRPQDHSSKTIQKPSSPALPLDSRSYSHHSDRAAKYRIVPFRLWASCGAFARPRTCGEIVGLAVAPGRAHAGLGSTCRTADGPVATFTYRDPADLACGIGTSADRRLCASPGDEFASIGRAQNGEFSRALVPAVSVSSVAAMCSPVTAMWSVAHSLTPAKGGPARAAGRLCGLVTARGPLCHPMRTTWPPLGHSCGPRPVAGAMLQLET